MSIWVGRPFDRLTVLSEVEGLTVLDKAEGRHDEPTHAG
jgi:hypothetical protein